MSTNPLYDYISSSAVSLTMAGNTGISPFLTLLLLGIIEMAKPELLNMGGVMETVLASWWSIAILGALSIAEMIGKCIPAVDEVIDSAETFVVPILSVLATMATLGLLPGEAASQEDAGLGESIDISNIFEDSGLGESFNVSKILEDSGLGESIDVSKILEDYGLGESIDVSGIIEDFGIRKLDEIPNGIADLGEFTDDDNFSEGFMTFTKIFLVIFGVGLSLSIHLCKMLVRLSSLACSGGCCQPCITILEIILVALGVVFAILAPAFAIVACLAFLVASIYVICIKCCRKKNKDDENDETNRGNGNNDKITADLETPEQEGTSSMFGEASAIEPVQQNDMACPPVEAFAVAELVDVPLNDNASITPKAHNKSDIEAKVYWHDIDFFQPN